MCLLEIWSGFVAENVGCFSSLQWERERSEAGAQVYHGPKMRQMIIARWGGSGAEQNEDVMGPDNSGRKK